MLSTSSSQACGPQRGALALAPAWHTAALVLLIVSVATVGTALGNGASAQPTALGALGGHTAARYAPLVLAQWSLVAYVCCVGRRHNALSDLLGARWTSLRRAGLDVALATTGWAVIEGAEAWFGRHGASPRPSTRLLLPHTETDRLVWMAVAASAGFCEEIVYRGYLQTQLAALVGLALGVTLQAVLFGLAHADQGPAVAVRFASYGAALGVLARWRRSLIPGIACHVAVDLTAGLVAT